MKMTPLPNSGRNRATAQDLPFDHALPVAPVHGMVRLIRTRVDSDHRSSPYQKRLEILVPSEGQNTEHMAVGIILRKCQSPC